MTSPKDSSAPNEVDDELKDMLFAQHQSGGSIDIIVTSDTQKEKRVPVKQNDVLSGGSNVLAGGEAADLKAEINIEDDNKGI